MKIEPLFHTNGYKVLQPEDAKKLGYESLTVVYKVDQKNNIIELPSTEGSEGLKALVQQLITWKPNTRGKTDCVMAMWFGVLRCREFMQLNMRSN